MTMRWRTIDGSALQFRSWDGEYVVYNALSGDAHLLEAEAMEVLLALQQQASDVPSLARCLAERWGCEADADFLREIDDALSDMHALALVERV